MGRPEVKRGNSCTFLVAAVKSRGDDGGVGLTRSPYSTVVGPGGTCRCWEEQWQLSNCIITQVTRVTLSHDTLN